MSVLDLKTQLEDIRSQVEDKLSRLSEIENSLKEREIAIKQAADSITRKLSGLIDRDGFIGFFEKPYAVIPQGKNRVLIAVPKFISNFQVGWLWKETETFYLYQFDQYSAWLSDAPKELLEEIDFKKEVIGTVDGDIVRFNPSQKEAIKRKLGRFIKEVTDTEARILRGCVFDVISEMVDGGCLPFKAKPVAIADRRDPKGKIKPRSYQQPAIKKFLDTGAIGVFHPTGAGKSYVALYAMDILKGPKLIVIPNRTLIDQWNYYIETVIPHAKDEIRITTYQGWKDTDEEYSLVVFDEAQRLPADTFSRLAVIRTKYRIGLSASPHREDGRERYIFALTGFPVGLNWREYMEETGKKYHPIYVHKVRNGESKLAKAYGLVKTKDRTLIFCDSIELGKKMAGQFSPRIPFVYGETEDRLQVVQENKVCVVSRVFDLGASIKDLKHIVEIDFLAGSRQQELQRTGRLMHSLEENTRHDIIMTQREFEEYGKRLWALSEKGFQVKVLEAR